MTKYYSLMVYENGFWSQQFGDYDRETVVMEIDDYREHQYKAKNLKLVITEDDQASIEAAVDELNRKEV